MKQPVIVEMCAKSADKKLAIQKLILGRAGEVLKGTFTQSTGAKVTNDEGIRIQVLGTRDGCHSDNTHKFPCSIYHADHIWPQELCTAYIDPVLEELGLLAYKPDQQELRPQCPRCSGHQGGKMSTVGRLAKEFAATINVQTYAKPQLRQKRDRSARDLDGVAEQRALNFQKYLDDKEAKKKKREK